MLPVALPANRQPVAWLPGRSPPAGWDPMFPSRDTDLKAAQTERFHYTQETSLSSRTAFSQSSHSRLCCRTSDELLLNSLQRKYFKISFFPPDLCNELLFVQALETQNMSDTSSFP